MYKLGIFKSPCSVVLAIVLACIGCSKDDSAIVGSQERQDSKETTGHDVKNGTLFFESYEALNAAMTQPEVLKKELSKHEDFISYNEIVDQIFASLDHLDIKDLSYFDQDDIKRYVKFIQEYGERAYVPTISSTLVGDVFEC